MIRHLHIALGQLQPRKGDYTANVARVGEVLASLGEVSPAPQVVQLPETVLSGYFVEGGAREVAVTAGTMANDLDASFREALARKSGGGRPVDVIIGFYEVWRETLHNSVAYVRLGDGSPQVLHVHRKAFLPTYGLFDEERFVERGHDLRAFDTPWGRASMLICEDAWHSLSGTIVALDNAEVIFISTATPARGAQTPEGETPGPANAARWERLVRDIAEEHGVFVSLANLVGSEGGKVFAGCSCLFGPRGDLRLRGPAWEEAMLLTSVDLTDIRRARADTPLLAELRTALPHLRAAMEKATAGGGNRGASPFDSASSFASPRAGGPPVKKNTAKSRGASPQTVPVPIISSPSDTAGPPPLDIDPTLVETWLLRFLSDEMRRRQMTHAVVGISGGVDSAVTAYLAARALGAGNVLGLRLPYRTSSAESLEHAQIVIDALGIPSRTIDISAAVDGYLACEPEADAGRRGNVMARTRMLALFDQSARLKGVPLGTGNKSERLLGYFTWHADDSPPINPLGDLFKTQVWALARHLGVPAVIVDKPATADLVAGQTDEADFGISYARADTILNWLVSGYSATDLVAREFDPQEVELVRRRLDGTHWKRKLPTVAMLSQTAIGESYLRPVDY
jgi:NAD+ synthetase